MYVCFFLSYPVLPLIYQFTTVCSFLHYVLDRLYSTELFMFLFMLYIVLTGWIPFCCLFVGFSVAEREEYQLDLFLNLDI